MSARANSFVEITCCITDRSSTGNNDTSMVSNNRDK